MYHTPPTWSGLRLLEAGTAGGAKKKGMKVNSTEPQHRSPWEMLHVYGALCVLYSAMCALLVAPRSTQPHLDIDPNIHTSFYGR